MKQPQRKRTTKYGFNTGQNRWAKSISMKDVVDSQSEMPGPGAYHVPLTIADNQKPHAKSGVFGSTERRFVKAENLKTPGPG